MASYEVVIVNYRTRTYLPRLLASLPEDVWVTVVDNSARVEPVDDLLRTRPRSRYLGMVENVGFAKAANHGAAQASQDVVIFVNPACFPDAAVLDALVAELESDPGCASCAPGIVSEGGVAQYGGGGWLPTIRRAAVQALAAHKVLPHSGIVVSPRLRTPLELEWLAGTCLAVKRSMFESVGGFDDRFFIYNEDMGLGRRLHNTGLRQLLRADLTVPHVGGASSRSSEDTVWRLRARSMVAYLDAYHRKWQAAVIRGTLVGGYLLRAAAYAALGKRKRVGEMVVYAGSTIWRRGASDATADLIASASPAGGNVLPATSIDERLQEAT